MTTPDQATGAERYFGLPAGATPAQLTTTHDALVNYLQQAPEELQPWATRQLRLARAAVEGTPAASDVAPEVAEDFSLLGLDEETNAPTATAATPVKINPPRKRGWLMPVSLAAASAAVVVGVYLMGGQPQEPNAQAAASASAGAQVKSTPKPVDPQMVATLEEKIKKDPKDVLSMKALGQIYDGAGEYDKAAAWQQRVTQVTPKDATAWLALGVAQFNGANLKDAEISWKRAATLDPKRQETFYNLGFLYLSQNNMDKAREAWATVVEIDPTTGLAETVKSHLKAPSASASAAASGKASAPVSANPSTNPSASSSR
ncbi:MULTISPECIES: tetratricopeptide repeat protein [unclassified Luteococcus]|uniref:tetratricopeptide repeat protein n=1 Tax=unclassified Luteococcus TaxID=2639923 RepID=UPI00313BA008